MKYISEGKCVRTEYSRFVGDAAEPDSATWFCAELSRLSSERDALQAKLDAMGKPSNVEHTLAPLVINPGCTDNILYRLAQLERAVEELRKMKP